MLFTLFHIWNRLNKEHPFYYEPLNVIRSGTQFMLIHSLVVTIISKSFEIQSIIIPILCMISCFTGFFSGVFIFRQKYKKTITNIFSRLKEKNILYINLENQYAHSSSNSDNSEKENSNSNSSSSSDSNEKNSNSLLNKSNDENESVESSESRSDINSSYSSNEDSESNKIIKNEVLFSKDTLNKINEKIDLFNSIEDISNKY